MHVLHVAVGITQLATGHGGVLYHTRLLGLSCDPRISCIVSPTWQYSPLHIMPSAPTDSAAGWDELLLKRLPEATLFNASARRLIALDMFEKPHIAPSHRRLPHPSWTTAFSLLVDLLLGAGKTRYLNTRPHARARREVFVRGFSAGSYSGICLLHLLWKLLFVEAHGKLGGIACPLELLCTIFADKGQGLHLFHYERDLLCCWQPTIDFIQKLPSMCTIVANDWADLNDHFGKSEREYGHWIDLPMQAGRFQL